MTICVKCNNLIKKKSGPDDTILYYCGAKELKCVPMSDPVTGKLKYIHVRGQGEIWNDIPYPFAKDINDGNCKYFQRKVKRGFGAIVRGILHKVSHFYICCVESPGH